LSGLSRLPAWRMILSRHRIITWLWVLCGLLLVEGALLENVQAQSFPAQLATATTDPAVIYTVTPQPDGSIVHEVQPGQALWSIAVAYNITIEDIRKYNGLGTAQVVWPGDKLFVAPSYTPTLLPTITNTPLPPTGTPRPTRTPRPPTNTPSQTLESAAEIVTPATATPRFVLPEMVPGSSARRILGMGMIVICALGILMVLIAGIRKR
jgi:LysM repeat protein